MLTVFARADFTENHRSASPEFAHAGERTLRGGDAAAGHGARAKIRAVSPTAKKRQDMLK